MSFIFRILKAAAIFAVITLIGCLIASKWCHINPSVEYDWYYGIWHGIFIIPNWVMSLMSDKSILCQAPAHTTSYTIWWWTLLAGHSFAALCILGHNSKQE